MSTCAWSFTNFRQSIRVEYILSNNLFLLILFKAWISVFQFSLCFSLSMISFDLENSIGMPMLLKRDMHSGRFFIISGQKRDEDYGNSDENFLSRKKDSLWSLFYFLLIHFVWSRPKLCYSNIHVNVTIYITLVK